MEGVNEVIKFIKKYNVVAEVLEFKKSVESVSSASAASGVPKSKILKTLIVIANGKPYVVIVPGDRKLNFKHLIKVLNVKKVRLAKPNEVKQITGMKPGEVSPLTDNIKNLKIIADTSILNKGKVLIGGGSLHHLVKIDIKELIKVLKPIIATVSEKGQLKHSKNR